VSKLKKANPESLDFNKSYFDKTIKRVSEKIVKLDSRDKNQFESATLAFQNLSDDLKQRATHVEINVKNLKEKMESVFESREKMTKEILSSFDRLHEKLDAHLVDEAGEFKKLNVELANIQSTLDNVQVNGGNYPLGEAMRHIYDQHVETHKKLEEIAALVEPIQARRKWAIATKELIKKNGLMHFLLKTKTGAIMGTVVFLLLANTITHTVFGVTLDLFSILGAAVKFFSPGS